MSKITCLENSRSSFIFSMTLEFYITYGLLLSFFSWCRLFYRLHDFLIFIIAALFLFFSILATLFLFSVLTSFFLISILTVLFYFFAILAAFLNIATFLALGSLKRQNYLYAKITSMTWSLE